MCNSDAATGEVAEVVAFDRVSGDALARHAFPSDDGNARGAGFCNDITFDEDGNLYATDSFGDSATNPAGLRRSRIVRVLADDLMNTSTAEIWLEHDDFEVPDTAFGLNGIDASGDGSLFVVRASGGPILEVPIESNGDAGDPVPFITAEPLEAGDGLKVVDDAILLVQSSTLTRVALADGAVTPQRSVARDRVPDDVCRLRIRRLGRRRTARSPERRRSGCAPRSGRCLPSYFAGR